LSEGAGMAKLAIDGGTPVRNTMLNYAHQWIDQGDIEPIIEVLRKVHAFENAIVSYSSTKAIVAVELCGQLCDHGASAVGFPGGESPIPSPRALHHCAAPHHLVPHAAVGSHGGICGLRVHTEQRTPFAHLVDHQPACRTRPALLSRRLLGCVPSAARFVLGAHLAG